MIVAKFFPQKWVYGNAVDAIDIATEEQQEWDVTDDVTALGREAALNLRDFSDSTDNLTAWPSAPAWVRNWSGPFYIRVEASIAAHYANFPVEA